MSRADAERLLQALFLTGADDLLVVPLVGGRWGVEMYDGHGALVCVIEDALVVTPAREGAVR